MLSHESSLRIIKALFHSLLEPRSVITLLKETVCQLSLGLNPCHSFVRVWILQEPIRVTDCGQLTTVHVIDIQLVTSWRKVIWVLKLPVLPRTIVYYRLMVHFEPVVPVHPNYGHSRNDSQEHSKNGHCEANSPS